MRYIFQDSAQAILDVFTELFGIRIAFFTVDGAEMKVGKGKSLCRYCELLRTRLGYEGTCLALDRDMRERAVTRRSTIRYECHGGMTEVVRPIFVEEQLIGFLMIGQYRTANRSVKPDLARAWQKQQGTDELERAFEQTPCYSKSYAANILRLFDVLVDHILYRHMIELYGSSSIQPLISFMRSHLEENLDLSEGSKIISQSQSSLAHKFKQMTGKSFKRFQIDLKLDRAEELFRKHPERTVKEIAFGLGYSDPFYFSRLYKKHRGLPPSEYRRRCRGGE